jgi:hypothetical protein
MPVCAISTLPAVRNVTVGDGEKMNVIVNCKTIKFKYVRTKLLSYKICKFLENFGRRPG